MDPGVEPSSSAQSHMQRSLQVQAKSTTPSTRQSFASLPPEVITLVLEQVTIDTSHVLSHSSEE